MDMFRNFSDSVRHRFPSPLPLVLTSSFFVLSFLFSFTFTDADLEIVGISRKGRMFKGVKGGYGLIQLEYTYR